MFSSIYFLDYAHDSAAATYNLRLFLCIILYIPIVAEALLLDEETVSDHVKAYVRRRSFRSQPAAQKTS
jgi:hypothetical protein